jgi:hypothetical protein
VLAEQYSSLGRCRCTALIIERTVQGKCIMIEQSSDSLGHYSEYLYEYPSGSILRDVSQQLVNKEKHARSRPLSRTMQLEVYINMSSNEECVSSKESSIMVIQLYGD